MNNYLTMDEIVTKELYSTKVSSKEIKEGWRDEYGVIYSSDGTKLLRANQDLFLEGYSIKEGTIVICDYAFRCGYNFSPLKTIIIPNTVQVIGDLCFSGCSSLNNIVLPDSIVNREKYPFPEPPRIYNEIITISNEILL